MHSSIQQSIDHIQEWSVANRLQLNGTKCKEMRIHFGKNNLEFKNINTDGIEIEIINHGQILCLTISNDLKWTQPMINKNTNKRMFFIIQLKRAKVPTSDIILFYCTCERPLLEYSCQVFHHALPV